MIATTSATTQAADPADDDAKGAVETMGGGGGQPAGPAATDKIGPGPLKILAKGPVAEAEFCERTGISRTDCRIAREEILKKGEGWDMVDRAIQLTGDGLAQLEAFFGVSLPPKKEGAGVGSLVVARRHIVRNARIMFCETAGGERVRCKVKDSAMFVPGQEIPARLVKSGLWEYAGAHPRKKGRLPAEPRPAK